MWGFLLCAFSEPKGSEGPEKKLAHGMTRALTFSFPEIPGPHPLIYPGLSRIDTSNRNLILRLSPAFRNLCRQETRYGETNPLSRLSP